MHEGSPYGYLKVNLKVILPPNLARIVGATLQETEGWLAELEYAGVFSRDQDGAIFSRRMIRDESIREARACGGKLGGNPALKDNHKVGGKVVEKVNLPANLQPTPSSSSSSSRNSELVYEAYPKKVARGAALKAIAKALKAVPFETLLARTKAYAESVSGSDPKYIPHPATWFNQERYLDDAVSCQPSAGSVTTKPEKPLSPLQRKIEELKARMVAHPGSPFNLLQYPRPTAAEDRKEYQKLDEELDALMFPDRAKQVPVDVGDDSEFRFGKETAA
jgi:hypothetical protein